MREKKAVFDDAVGLFLPVYPELREKAKRPKPDGLGDMFRDADYPDEATVRTKFNFKFQVMPIPAGTDFRLNLAGEEIDALREQFAANLKDREADAMGDVWNRLYAVVKKASDDLNDPEKGVHKALFENAKEICAILPRVNIAGSAEFDRLVKEVEEKIASASPEILRKSKVARNSIAAEALRIEQHMAQFLQPRN
jgi:hypothetical protein